MSIDMRAQSLAAEGMLHFLHREAHQQLPRGWEHLYHRCTRIKNLNLELTLYHSKRKRLEDMVGIKTPRKLI